MIQKIQMKLPLKIVHKWVKGHQDELENNGKKIFGLFTRDAQLNIEMDGVALAGAMLPPHRHQMYPVTKIAIYTKKDVMITDIKSFLHEHINGEKLHSYISKNMDGKGNRCNILTGKP